MGRPVDHDAVGAKVAELEPDLVALRRRLHRHPEPSWEEHRTTEVLVEQLDAAGLHPQIPSGGTGVICDLGDRGPLVAIRADIDALRLTDLKAVEYRSEVPGVCHACGHDVHTSAALGATLALADHLSRADLPGRVRLIMQPAEESVPGGASALSDAGAMEGVAAIFALHCDPALDVGSLGVSAGAITSAADQVSIRLKGAGGHTARPQSTADLVFIAAKVVLDLTMGLNRLSDPRDGINLTFGSIHAGHAPNVIPAEATILGSLRATGRPSWEAARPIIRSLLVGIVEPLGATWELDHRIGAPPIENDRWAVEQVERTGLAVLGPAGVGPTRQSTGGEDFSWYLDHAPGAYFRLGVRTPGAPTVDIHAGNFDVDERAIALGARLLAGTALEALAELT